MCASIGVFNVLSHLHFLPRAVLSSVGSGWPTLAQVWITIPNPVVFSFVSHVSLFVLPTMCSRLPSLNCAISSALYMYMLYLG